MRQRVLPEPDESILAFQGRLVTQALADALTMVGLDTEPMLTTREPSFVDCCKGRASVNMGTLFPFFDSSTNCAAVQVPWEFRVTRCIEVDDDGGILPEHWQAGTLRALDDLSALLCVTAEMGRGATIQTATIEGPEVNCITALVTVQLRADLGC